MKAPLPEVPPQAPKKRDFAKAAPLSLTIICALKVGVTFLYLIPGSSAPDWTPFWYWTVSAVFTVFSLLLIYGLWRGYGLARGFWLWITVLFVPFYLFPDESIRYTLAEQILNWFDLALGFFSLFYLNLPNVKAHFAQRTTVE